MRAYNSRKKVTNSINIWLESLVIFQDVSTVSYYRGGLHRYLERKSCRANSCIIKYVWGKIRRSSLSSKCIFNNAWDVNRTVGGTEHTTLLVCLACNVVLPLQSDGLVRPFIPSAPLTCRSGNSHSSWSGQRDEDPVCCYQLTGTLSMCRTSHPQGILTNAILLQ